MQYLSVVASVFIHLALLFATSARAGESLVRTVPIPTLASGCSVTVKWVGLWQTRSEGAFLNCGGRDVLITSPSNLLGNVRMKTPDEALGFVRAFTSPETYQLFDLSGMVELLPGDTSATDAAFNVVSPQRFKQFLKTADVTEVADHPCRPGLEFACGKEFRITRSVVFPDGRVYQVVESVYESGFYQLTARHILLRDATKIGVLHFGDL
jgi:hypothetical protein